MTIIVLLKFFFITLCGFYVICKIQNLRPSKLQLLLILIGSIIVSLVSTLIKHFIPTLYILTLVIPFLLVGKLILKQPFKIIIPLGLTAIAVSHIFAIVSLFIFSGIAFLVQMFYNITANFWFNLIQAVFIGLFQIFFAFIIFKIKRFRRGIPNIDNYINSDISMFISISIIMFLSFTEIKDNNNIAIIAIAFFIIFFGIILFFAWKMRFNKIYINRQKQKEVEELQSKIIDLDSQIQKLKADNQCISSVIHRDNKTISSFINTLNNISNNTTDENNKEQLTKFLEYLHQEHGDRLTYLSTDKLSKTASPKSQVFAVDSILEFMKNKANQYDINLEMTFDCDISNLTPSIIKETDLVTILADLIDNAIIATRNSDLKTINVQFSIVDNCYVLKICDSGIPFETPVLKNFGTKQITTHQNDGGRGIGLVTVFSIIQRIRASLFLVQDSGAYTKIISIVFDNQSHLVITNNLDTDK